MAKTNVEKSGIAQEIMEWCDEVTLPDRKTIQTEYYHGKIITSTFELYRLRKKMMKIQEYAIDTEFTSLRIQHPGESDLVGLSISWGKYNNYYIPMYHTQDPDDEQIPAEQVAAIMKKVFNRMDVRVIGHNLKTEFHILENYGMSIKTDDIFDTMIAIWNIDENNEKGLKETVLRYYDYNQRHFNDILLTVPKEVKLEYGYTAQGKGDASLVKVKHLAPYAMDDTYWTWQIYLDIYDAMEEEGVINYFFQKQMPYLRVLFNMERRGVKVDFERLRKMSKMAEKDMDDLAYQIYEIAGLEFSITSGQQLAEILFGYRKMKPVYQQVQEIKDGEPQFYKSGPRKGQPKLKDNKNVVIGEEFCGNQHLVDNAYNFPVQSVTKKGVPSTGADDLEALMKKQYKRDRKKMEGQKMLNLILRYKRLSKLKSTYMEGLAEQVYSDGKIHASFNQAGTTSGRLSSSEPNLQNLPRSLDEVYEPIKEKYPSEEEYKIAVKKYKEVKAEYDFWARYEIRDAFIPDDSEEQDILACDYSNLEMRVLTHFSQDPLLISMFEREADAHGDTAVNMYKLDCDPDDAKKLYPQERQAAKTINFLLVYGGSPKALSDSLGVDKKEAQGMYNLYFETYEGVADYIKGQQRSGHKNECVYTVLGRRRHLDGINSGDRATEGYYERLAINAPIQGSAADIAISAQILIEHDPILKKLGYVQILQVHDEVVGLAPVKNKEKIAERKKYLMENCLPRPLTNVRLRVDYDFGKTYAQAK